MPYDALVLKVMIASPGDVQDLRSIIREVVNEWNAVHSEHMRVVLLPIGWDSHAAPEMGERPQEIINRQLLADADLLIAAFWTRLGSPTGKAQSGTVEEIEEHIAAGKPAMLYFSAKPVSPESIDPNQYAALRDFKERCRRRGLIETFDSNEEFRSKLVRQLAQVVIEKFPVRSGGNVKEKRSRLSHEAQSLLLAAAADQNGLIMRFRSSSGLAVQTNGRNFVDSRDPRVEATWDDALRQLSVHGLLQTVGHKGETFRITKAGFDEVDRLKAESK